MLTIWKYISKEFLKIFLLSIFVFIALLLVVRGQEIARFALLSPDLKSTLLFLLYQIPFILPLAVPISTLISAYLLMRSLSISYELTSLRASGLSFFKTLFPVYVIGVLLSVANFILASEIGSFSRLKSVLLPQEIIENDPLLVLSKNSNSLLKQSYSTQQLDPSNKKSSNFVLAVLDKGLSLTTVKELSLEEKNIKAHQVSTILPILQTDQNQFDNISLENTEEMALSKEEFINRFRKPLKKIKFEHLPMKACLIKTRISQTAEDLAEGSIEIYRRLFSLVSPFTFLLIAIAFGTSIGRSPSRKNLMFSLLLTLFILIGFMGAKSLKSKPMLSLALFMIPQVISIFFSLYFLRKTLRGVH